MKVKKFFAHTVIDILEFELEFAKRMAVRTGWYKQALKRIFDRAEMPISDALLNNLLEEEIYDIEKVLESFFLTLRNGVDNGDLPAEVLHDLVMWCSVARKRKEAPWVKTKSESINQSEVN